MRGRLQSLVVPLLGLVVFLFLPVGASASPAPSALDLDCLESPTPDMPGTGLAGFFSPTPDNPPARVDSEAIAADANLYEQYGFAGLRWNTYDLGCGPGAARNPEAVIGTALSNWLMNIPVSVAALTASVTDAAFHPSFLDVFDPMLSRVSTALHVSLFERWVPAALALLGLILVAHARGLALSSTAGAVAWALLVLAVAAALFRWPVEAGHGADESVTRILSSAVNGLQGDSSADPADATASSIQNSILYTSWLAGELGSTTSETAKRFGPLLFRAQTLTWREAAIVGADPDAGQQIIESKRRAFADLAAIIKQSDPTAYDHLTGRRADTRIGYALLATVATLLALPFLLVSSLMLLGSYLVVRLAVMLFPAFATLGVLPAARGAVTGIGRTVGAALVNSVIFGIGAAVAVVVMGAILDPATLLPPWLRLVLLPVASLILWVALKPFRRLSSMSPRHDRMFADAVTVNGGARNARRLTRRLVGAAAASYAGNVAAATAMASSHASEEPGMAPPTRAEAHPPSASEMSSPVLALAGPRTAPTESPATDGTVSSPDEPAALNAWAPSPTNADPIDPVEPEWVDGEEIYPIYRPSEDSDVGSGAADVL